MANEWIKALKKYNQGKSSWCIPKKGTTEYKKVMQTVKLPKAMKRAGKDKPDSKSKLEDAMRRAEEDS